MRLSAATVLCTALSLSHALVLRPARPPMPARPWAERNQLPLVRMGYEVPPEVREAEGKTPAASGRGLRFTAYVALGGLAVVTGFIYAGAAVGIEAVEELADSLAPFDSVYLGIVLDGGVLATCYWLWQQEVTTREENVQRIWEELQRRRAAPAKRGKKQQAGFTKKKKASRSTAAPAGGGSGGFGSSTAAPEAAVVPAPAQEPPAAEPPAAAPAAPAPAGGFQKMWDEMYEQADSLGRAQALTLNSALEERGVLPKLQSPGEAEAEPVSVSPPPPAVPAEADAGVAPTARTSGGPSKKAVKKKKKKKR